jgi:hypothetical protein
MTSLRRWVLDIEWKWGVIDRWPVRCIEEWATIKSQGKDAVQSWLEQGSVKVATGRRVLGYLEHVMEGDLHNNVEEWRDLYAQGYQLTAGLHSGVIGLEHQLYLLRTELEISE